MKPISALDWPENSHTRSLSEHIPAPWQKTSGTKSLSVCFRCDYVRSAASDWFETVPWVCSTRWYPCTSNKAMWRWSCCGIVSTVKRTGEKTTRLDLSPQNSFPRFRSKNFDGDCLGRSAEEKRGDCRDRPAELSSWRILVEKWLSILLQ